MKKIAFFVEGATELAFLERLLKEILTANKFAIETRTMRGGSKRILEIVSKNKPSIHDEIETFILITDCGSDSTVKSYILEQRDSLIKAGYIAIIGLLDLYPKLASELHAFNKGLLWKVPQKPIPIEFVISVMEIEAWFIAEKNHFLKKNQQLTEEFILERMGFDLSTVNIENITEPSKTLNSIYSLVASSYKKNAKHLQKVINELDYANIYFELPKTVKSLEKLINLIENYVVK